MATKYGGYMGKVLKVDLTTQEVCEYPWTDQERELYLGGKIMAAKIMWDNINRRFDPLGEENLLVITTGPITGSGAPSSSRFNISTISPLTGLLVSSNCGGNFGLHLKKAGYDGLVISGRAEKPVWLEVTDQKIQFHPADTLWGQSTSATQNLLGKPGGKIVIGPAGENLVLYAGIFSQERAAGRGGAGAVMGAKKLKAIVADGRQRTVAVNPDKTRELNRQWINYLQKHPVTGRILPELGTANLIRRMQRRNMLATRNFSRGQYEDYESLSGEYLAEYHLIKNSGCPTCPIRCSRVVEVNGREIKGPELETLGLLGPNIENNDLKRICEWNYLLDELGMDTMSTGGTLAFAMELQEKGMWDCGLKFGETDIISEIIRKIAYREEIGDLLADGSRKLADRFGGHDFAMQVKGLELAAYEPRGAVGQGLGYAVANRGGCHLNAGYMAFMEGLGLAMNNHTAQSKAALTIFMQNMMEAVSAAGNCVFTTYAFIPGVLLDDNKSAISFLTNNILKWSSGLVSILNHQQSWLANFHLGLLPHTKALSTLTGMNITFGKFLQIGARGYNLERLFNMRLGLTGDHDKLPLRLTNEYQVPGVKKSRVPLPQLKKDYYRQRGWDKTGFPLKKTIRKLGLPTNTV
jgi:aldehyde:ferredoxin oxidoreductase